MSYLAYWIEKGLKKKNGKTMGEGDFKDDQCLVPFFLCFYPFEFEFLNEEASTEFTWVCNFPYSDKSLHISPMGVQNYFLNLSSVPAGRIYSVHIEWTRNRGWNAQLVSVFAPGMECVDHQSTGSSTPNLCALLLFSLLTFYIARPLPTISK